MLKEFATMVCRMSLKVRMLQAHLDKVENNNSVYSEEQGERFIMTLWNTVLKANTTQI